jgi:hypothetical protein
LPPVARPSTTSKVVVDVEDTDHQLIAGVDGSTERHEAPSSDGW